MQRRGVVGRSRERFWPAANAALNFPNACSASTPPFRRVPSDPDPYPPTHQHRPSPPPPVPPPPSPPSWI